MNIFLCRHAQVHNPKKIVYRRLPGYYLSKQGEAEAEEMGLFLKKYKIKEIFTSPMERCVQTAGIIKKTIDNPAIKIYQKDYLNEWDEGEKTTTVAKRMKHILRDKKDNRVYISHQHPIRVFLNEITSQPPRELEQWDCPAGAIYEIAFGGKKVLPKLLFVPKETDKPLIPKTKFSKSLFVIGAAAVAFFVVTAFVAAAFFGAPQRGTEPEQFTVALDGGDSGEVAAELASRGFIKSKTAFHIALLGLKGINLVGVDCVSPGAYKISKSMNVWQIAKAFKQDPYMKWVVIPEGLRKEQIGEILAQALNWDEQKKRDWVAKYTAMKYDYLEGVYFPDTYLIPTDETGLEIAQRFINKFNEKFAPYADKFLQENISWTTALKIASI